MPDDGMEIEAGSVAPDFALESNDGTVVHLTDYRNRKHVVLYFMREFG